MTWYEHYVTDLCVLLRWKQNGYEQRIYVDLYVMMEQERMIFII